MMVLYIVMDKVHNICRCPEMWLKLPIDIKYSATHDAFKHKIKQHYIGKY